MEISALPGLIGVAARAGQRLVARVQDRRARDSAFTLAVDELPTRLDRGWSLVTAGAVRRAAGPTQLRDTALRSWFIRTFDAVACDELVVRLTVTNRRHVTMRLTDVHAFIQVERPALDGTRIDHDPAGAADAEGVLLDLDSGGGVALADRWPEPSTVPYFSRRAVELAPEESVTFVVRLTGHQRFYEFRLRVSGSRPDGTDSFVQAAPFVHRLSGASAAAPTLLWAWWEQPPGLRTPEEVGLED